MGRLRISRDTFEVSVITRVRYPQSTGDILRRKLLEFSLLTDTWPQVGLRRATRSIQGNSTKLWPGGGRRSGRARNSNSSRLSKLGSSILTCKTESGHGPRWKLQQIRRAGGAGRCGDVKAALLLGQDGATGMTRMSSLPPGERCIK
jgi:hypothetical protein